MESLLSDVRYAVRNLLRRPGFTIIAVVTLALGIGANTAIFSAVHALLLKPLQFPELDRVVAIWDKLPSRGVLHNEVTVANYLDWRSQTQSFEQLALYRWWSANLTGIDTPERIQGFLVTANFIDATGMKPIMGRNFLAEENQPGKDAVAIITHSLWQRRFGGDPDILQPLIACANVANLMLARASGRRKEIALRTALGASRWRIVRQLLTESLIVALVGGGVGTLIGFWGIDALRAGNPGDAAKFAPGWYQLGINAPVLLFTLGISLLSGIVFGLAPALQASKTNLNDSLKEGSRQTSGSSHRLRSSLVVFEFALSLVLLVGAGLLTRSFLSLLKTDPGFNPDHLLTMNLMLPGAKYKDDPARAAFYHELIQRVQAYPGVESAAVVNYLPLGGANSSDSYLVEGEPEPAPGQENDGRYRVATPDYFRTMQISIVRGRGFTEQDKAGTPPVVMVNEAFVRRHWPNQDPLGKRIRFYGPLERAPWLSVVGVIADVKHELNLPVTPEYYLPYAQDPWPGMVLVAKTSVEPASLAGALRQQVWAIDKDQPVFDVKTMQEVRSTSVAVYSFSSVMLGIFAFVALLLASIGIYGVMAFAVAQRTVEIGIRIALGARSADVLKLVVTHGMKLALLGMVLGLGGSWALTRFMEKLLVGVQATDLLTFGLVSVCLLVAAFVACYLPARRATKVDPLVALRYE